MFWGGREGRRGEVWARESTGSIATGGGLLNCRSCCTTFDAVAEKGGGEGKTGGKEEGGGGGGLKEGWGAEMDAGCREESGGTYVGQEGASGDRGEEK